MDGWMDACMHACMDGWMDGWTDSSYGSFWFISGFMGVSFRDIFQD